MTWRCNSKLLRSLCDIQRHQWTVQIIILSLQWNSFVLVCPSQVSVKLERNSCWLRPFSWTWTFELYERKITGRVEPITRIWYHRIRREKNESRKKNKISSRKRSFSFEVIEFENLSGTRAPIFNEMYSTSTFLKMTL